MTGWDSLRVEIGFASNPKDEPQTYTDVTAYLEGIDSTNRGRDNVLDHFPTGTGQFTLDNSARTFDPLSAKSTNTYLSLPGVAGNYVTSPDSPPLSPTGDLDIRARVQLTDWTPNAADSAIVAKWGAAGSRAWEFGVTQTTGTLFFRRSSDGTATAGTHPSTVATGFTDGTAHWVRVTVDVNNGAGSKEFKFYTSTDNITWTQLGTTVTDGGTFALSDTTAAIEIGSDTVGTARLWAGRVYRVDMFASLNETAFIANPDFAFGLGAGTTAFTDTSPSANNWTINSSGGSPAAIVYVSDAIVPRKRVRISASDSTSTRQNVFVGTIDAPDGWDFDYSPPAKAEATVKCSEFFDLIGEVDLTPTDSTTASYLGSGSTVDSALTTLFAFMPIPAAWYPAGSISASDTLVGSSGQAFLLTGTMLDLFFKLADAEPGDIFMSRNGYITFHDRFFPVRDASMATSQATFSDTGSNVDYDDVKFGHALALVNDARANRAASWTPTAQVNPPIEADVPAGVFFQHQDTSTQASFGIHTKSLADLWVASDAEADARAELLLNLRKNAKYAPYQLVLAPTDADNILDQALQRDLLDRITIVFSPPGGGSAVTVAAHIQKIEHRIPVQADPRTWQTIFTLSPAAVWDFFDYSLALELDHATKGKLNTGKLGY